MAERSLLCWAKCCGRPRSQENDNDTWMEPISRSRRSKNSRHVSKKIRNKKTSKTAENELGAIDDGRPTLDTSDGGRRPSIRWADVIDSVPEGRRHGGSESHMSLISYDTADIDDSRHDTELYESVNSKDFVPQIGTLGDITIGTDLHHGSFNAKTKTFGPTTIPPKDDGITRESDSDISKDSDDLMQEETTGKRERLRAAGRKIKGKLSDPGSIGLSIPHRDSGITRANDSDIGKNTDDLMQEETMGKRQRFARKTMAAGRKIKDKLKLAGDHSAKMPLNRSSTQSTVSTDESTAMKLKPITSIAVLSDDCILTASRASRVISMFKLVRSLEPKEVELVREFKKHKGVVTALAILDKKGRFLSAGTDKTVMLWDSRFDCEDELEDDDEKGSLPEPVTLLSVFPLSGRWVHSIGVLSEGSYVRPTDNVDAAMLTAVAKKTVLDGAASVQRAANQREIIECSGAFVTASKNDHVVKVWEMTLAEEEVEDPSNRNVAEIKVSHELDHDASIQALAVGQDILITGDVMGNVFLWENKRRSYAIHKNWMRIAKFTPWRDGSLHSPDELSQQCINGLCFLDEKHFVASVESGKIRVWNLAAAEKTDVIHKKYSKSVKVTSKSLSAIHKLPNVKDPKTGEDCLAFSVSTTDGSVVSMALQPQDSAKRGHTELVIFDLVKYSPEVDESANDSASDNAIHSIAASETFLVAGDDYGTIHLSKPKWES